MSKRPQPLPTNGFVPTRPTRFKIKYSNGETREGLLPLYTYRENRLDNHFFIRATYPRWDLDCKMLHFENQSLVTFVLDLLEVMSLPPYTCPL